MINSVFLLTSLLRTRRILLKVHSQSFFDPMETSTPKLYENLSNDQINEEDKQDKDNRNEQGEEDELDEDEEDENSNHSVDRILEC